MLSPSVVATSALGYGWGGGRIIEYNRTYLYCLKQLLLYPTVVVNIIEHILSMLK